MPRFLLTIIILGLVIWGAIAGYNYLADSFAARHINLPANFLAATSTGTATSTSSQSATSTATTTMDISKFSGVSTAYWKTYSNDELGYSIKYPGNMNPSVNGSVLTLVFAKDKYFHWPLQDEAKVTVSIATSCPPLTVDGALSVPTTTFMLNGYVFSGHEGHGAAAGNLYNEWAFDTLANNSCYRIDLFDHAANGAGLYVGDPALIRQYDDQHERDMQSVRSIFYGISDSFRIRATSAGIPEDQALPQSR